MMGSRGSIDGDEYDAFCRRSRHLLTWRRGELHRIKKRFAKRQRRLSRLRLKGYAVA